MGNKQGVFKPRFSTLSPTRHQDVPERNALAFAGGDDGKDRASESSRKNDPYKKRPKENYRCNKVRQEYAD